MSLDLSVVVAEWRLVIGLLVDFTIAKGAAVFSLARLFGSSNVQALRCTSMYLQGG